MKVLYVLAAILGFSLATNFRDDKRGVRIYESQINATLECIRGLLIEGIPEANFPSLAPAHLGNISVNLEGIDEKLKGEVNIENIVLDGITGWELKDLKIKLNIIGGIGATVTAKLNIPSLKLNADYDADASIMGIRMWGVGEIIGVNDNFEVQLDTKALLSGMKLDRIKLLPRTDNLNIKFTGLYGDEEESAIISQLGSELAMIIINEKAQDISDFLEEIILGIVNGPANKAGSDSIMDIIFEKCPFGLL